MRFLSVSAVFLVVTVGHAFAAAADGKTVYDSKCKMCHGADGSGNPAIAKAMKVTMRPLGSAEVQAKHDNDLKNDVTQGTGKMQPITGLTDKQLTDLVAYLRTLKK